jgi:alpha-galactosidase
MVTVRRAWIGAVWTSISFAVHQTGRTQSIAVSVNVVLFNIAGYRPFCMEWARREYQQIAAQITMRQSLRPFTISINQLSVQQKQETIAVFAVIVLDLHNS